MKTLRILLLGLSLLGGLASADETPTPTPPTTCTDTTTPTVPTLHPHLPGTVTPQDGGGGRPPGTCPLC